MVSTMQKKKSRKSFMYAGMRLEIFSFKWSYWGNLQGSRNDIWDIRKLQSAKDRKLGLTWEWTFHKAQQHLWKPKAGTVLKCCVTAGQCTPVQKSQANSVYYWWKLRSLSSEGLEGFIFSGNTWACCRIKFSLLIHRRLGSSMACSYELHTAHFHSVSLDLFFY